MKKRNDPTGFRELLGLISQANAAGLELDWLRAIELYQKALALGKPKEADKYFAQSIKFIKASVKFEADQENLKAHIKRPLRELPFEIEGLPFTDEPYNGLVVPDVLPVLQHTVHMLRPHGINVHAWMFETIVAMEAEPEAEEQKFLPDYLSPAAIDRLRRPRQYNPDEAVILRGQDGYLYKLVAPGKLTKVRGSRK